jgi:hypothetical protein
MARPPFEEAFLHEPIHDAVVDDDLEVDGAHLVACSAAACATTDFTALASTYGTRSNAWFFA